MWYSGKEHGYSHWGSSFPSPRWNPTENYKTSHHTPPRDIGSSFYPKLGCYHSASQALMETHMNQFLDAGIGVAVVSWYPVGKHDQSGALPPDDLMPLLLNIAEKYNIKIAIHIEPYENRSPLTVREDLKYIHRKYATHPAYFMTTTKNNTSKLLPLVYIYDSYLSSVQEWSSILTKSGSRTIRDTAIDTIVIGLIIKMEHVQSVKASGFNGFYTYFASDGLTYASTIRNWAYLSILAKQSDLIFIPSAGPGYDDTRVRPWNKINSRDRKNGEYYKTMMFEAILSSNGIVSITSFNEWHEGTQIEPALSMSSKSFKKYLNYEPFSPKLYLSLTAEMSKSMQCHKMYN